MERLFARSGRKPVGRPDQKGRHVGRGDGAGDEVTLRFRGAALADEVELAFRFDALHRRRYLEGLAELEDDVDDVGVALALHHRPGKGPIDLQLVDGEGPQIVDRGKADAEIVERCILPLINIGAQLLEDGVAYRPLDIDVVWTAGYGFPRHLGGPMFYADTLGLKNVLARIEHYHGKYGLSMKTHGLDWTNNNAEARAIVIHNAWYAEPEMIAQHGKLGRSQGCFAFSRADQWSVMRRLAGGRMIYADKIA